MARDPLDLTGRWHGTFAYPRNYGPATPFLATVEDKGGAFSGSIIEPDAFYGTGDTLHARLSGHRAGRSVDFTKTYLDRRHGYENPVDYVGLLSEDGSRIAGVWSLLEFNGTFEMHREEMREEPESVEVEEAVAVAVDR